MKRVILILLGFVFALFAFAVIWNQWWPKPQPPPSGVFASEPVWSYTAPEEIISTPAVSQGRVYLRSSQSVFAVSAIDGSFLWRADSPGVILLTHPPVAFADVLVVPELDGEIAVFEADTGNLLWRDSPEYHANVETITYSQETLIVARFAERITAYNLYSGEIRWQIDIPDRGFTQVVADGDVLITNNGDRLSEYLIPTGELLWQDTAFPYMGSGRMLLDSGFLYIARSPELQDNLTAYDVSRRAFVWTALLEFSLPAAYIRLVSDDGTVYIAGSSLMAVSAQTGERLWETEQLGILEQPVVLGDSVYVVDTGFQSTLYAFDRLTGEQVGSLYLGLRAQRDPPAELGPAVVGDLLIVRVDNRTVYAYRP